MRLRHLILIIVVTLFVSLPLTTHSFSDLKKVLYISSYSESFDSVPLQIKGIKEAFFADEIQLDIEYMDTKRFPVEENIQLFYDLIKYKLAHGPSYDGIILGDDSALQFAMDYQEELFGDIPMVYLAINDYNRAVKAEKYENMTGIYEHLSLKENIDLALTLNPHASKIIGIIDSTYTGIGDLNQFLEYEKDYPNLDFEYIDSSNYNFKEMADIIGKIKEDTLLFYLSMYSDKDGTYITIDSAAKFFLENSKVPVYRASIGGVGKGILGGKMLLYDEMGEIAGGMLLEVFNGKPIDTIPMVTETPSNYILDYELLKRYDIDLKLLPEGTTFVNKKVSFYEENKELAQWIIAIMSILLFFSILLALDNVQRRKIEKALEQSKERLEHANEELVVAEEEMRQQYDVIQEHSEEIKILNDKYIIAMKSVDGIVWEVNTETRTVFMSENIKNLSLGSIKETEDVSKLMHILFEKQERKRLIREYIQYRNGEKENIDIQLKFKTHNDEVKWVLVRGGGIKDSKGKEVMLCGILVDVTKSVERDLHIKHFARHDYLTDLPNRLSLTEKLHEEVSAGHPTTVLMLDLDNFKDINDIMGHGYGDYLLKEVSKRFRQITSDKMSVYRFGGDEFLILIPRETDMEKIRSFIEKIELVFRNPFILDLREYKVEFSMGIARYPIDSKNVEELFMNADTAMYKVKSSGKNGYLFYDNEMKAAIKEKARITRILKNAITEDGFYLVYQPKVKVSTGEIVGFEALLRLKNHRISPNVFIEIAEETNLILEIGRKVTVDAIAQLVAWREMGYQPKPVSINFSSKQIKDIDYVEFLGNLLEEKEVPPEYFEIEITESILLEETEVSMKFLNDLREIGVRIALDDFGTGYSSLNYLTYIPVDHVKLDKSMCDKFLQLENVKVMDSLISLSHSLGLEITAEGIENESQYKQLKKGNCDYIQGYYFSIPLGSRDVNKIYNKVFLV